MPRGLRQTESPDATPDRGLRPLWRAGIHWANVAQSARFQRRLRLLQPYSVASRIACADAKHVYFTHRFVSAGTEHAQVHVKVKFKRGPVTVSPQALFGDLPDAKPASLAALGV